MRGVKKVNYRAVDFLVVLAAMTLTQCKGGDEPDPTDTAGTETSTSTSTTPVTGSGAPPEPELPPCVACQGGVLYHCGCKLMGVDIPSEIWGGRCGPDNQQGSRQTQCEMDCSVKYVELVEDAALGWTQCSSVSPTSGDPTTGGDPTFGGEDPLVYNCSSWDPSDNVTLISGLYYYQWSFLSDLTSNPTPLLVCDDAYLEPLSTSSGFQVGDANSGELLYELGLRNGDIPLAINGMPLSSVADAWEAFNELWGEGELLFDLYILRGTSNMTLSYEPLIAE